MIIIQWSLTQQFQHHRAWVSNANYTVSVTPWSPTWQCQLLYTTKFDSAMTNTPHHRVWFSDISTPPRLNQGMPITPQSLSQQRQLLYVTESESTMPITSPSMIQQHKWYHQFCVNYTTEYNLTMPVMSDFVPIYPWSQFSNVNSTTESVKIWCHCHRLVWSSLLHGKLKLKMPQWIKAVCSLTRWPPVRCF